MKYIQQNNAMEHLDLSKYDTETKDEILSSLEKNNEILKYLNGNFSSGQIVQIIKGIDDGLDVSCYADEKYCWNDMMHFREGLKKGYNFLDYSHIINIEKNYCGFVFHELVKALDNNYDIDLYKNMTFFQMEAINYGLDCKVDVSLYTNKNYDGHKMRRIAEWMSSKHGKYIYDYLDIIEDLDHERIELLSHAVSIGFDLKNYIFNSIDKIRVLIDGYKNNIDMTKYLDYRSTQMKEIRMGIKQGLDISKYLDKNISAKNMQKIRMELKKDKKI